MIYVRFSDRLGNNLFQFAAAKSIDQEVTIVVDSIAQFDYVEQFHNLFYKGAGIVVGSPIGSYEFIEEGYHFSEIQLTKYPTVLNGYFQSHKYINREIILNQYKITKEIENSIRAICDIDFGDYTSIHIRRGDYKEVQYKHPLCNLDYFTQAIKYMGADKKYLIVSDDLDWCKSNLQGDNLIYFDGSSLVNDLYVQSLCAHNIISNSSFGWWGAYLNANPNKRVVAPHPWFGKFSQLDSNDLLPNEYQLITYKRKLSVMLIERFQLYRDLFFYYVR